MDNNTKKSLGFNGTIRLLQEIVAKDSFLNLKIKKFKDLKELFYQAPFEEEIPIPSVVKKDALKILTGLGLNPQSLIKGDQAKELHRKVRDLYKVFVINENGKHLAKLEVLSFENNEIYYIIQPAKWIDILIELFVKNSNDLPKEEIITENFTEIPSLLRDGKGPFYIRTENGTYLRATDKTEKEILKRWKAFIKK